MYYICLEYDYIGVNNSRKQNKMTDKTKTERNKLVIAMPLQSKIIRKGAE